MTRNSFWSVRVHSVSQKPCLKNRTFGVAERGQTSSNVFSNDAIVLMKPFGARLRIFNDLRTFRRVL